MLDYYQILGIDSTATTTEVKSAYKKLAFDYHPDRNPNNPAAEEKFKEINEAYQILSDPYKKASYDLLVSYSEQGNTTSGQQRYRTPPRKHEEKSVYDRYAKFDWRNAPRYKTAPAYKIDKNYLKNQSIAFAAVAFLAILIIGAFNFSNYLDEQEELRIQQENQLVIDAAKKLYDKGEYREAISDIVELIRKYPIRHSIYEVRESMVANLAVEAESQFNSMLYKDAVEKLEVVKDFERPMHLNTWKMLADCYNQLGDFRKAAHAYDYVLLRDEHNIELMMKLGDIYLDHLDMKSKALDYYTEARYKFKEFQGASYGDAFELIVPLETFPEIYFELFYKRGKINYELENYEEAIHDFNWAVSFRPKIAESYHLRALCRQEMGNDSRACEDLKSAVALNFEPSIVLQRSLCF